MNTAGTVHIVFGPQGAGKSTYSRQLAGQHRAILFSIDEWMHQLYGPDLPRSLDFGWIMERVGRCEKRIWDTAAEIAGTGGNVVLDLGFMKIDSRTAFADLAESCSLLSQLHFVDAPHDIRRQRVLARNTEKGETFSFEVTPGMFDFMEKQFERPTEDELSKAIVSVTQ